MTINRNSLHILVIEDSADTRANLCDILELDGHSVETIGSIAEAANRGDWSDITAVILDRQLPDGTALDLLPNLKKWAPDAPVIVVTGHPDIEGAIVALRRGAYDYLLKPINPDALRAGIHRIAERRQAQRRLAESKARTRALLDAIPDTMFRLSRTGVCLDYRTHRGSTNDDRLGGLLGNHLSESSLPEEVVERMLAAIDETLATGEVESLEYVLPRDGETQHFEARLVKSGVDEVVAIIRDVTEHRRAAQRALQTERLAAIGQMVAGLAHESRNAFQRSQACLEMLAMEVEDHPEALELIERIQKAQDHLHHLYEEVRHYAAPINLERQLCDLAQIWRDTWAHLEVARQQKQVELREQSCGMDLTCRADPHALEQLFRNILENALAACREPATIVIRCCGADIDGNDAVQIAFCDNGPGFDRESRAKVFEPFFTTKTKGTGLGMAIARRIVEAHGGRIAVGDLDEPGGRVFVTLPRS